MKMSKHLIDDRLERTAYILSHIALGEPLQEQYCPPTDTCPKPCKRVLTTTGLIIAYSVEKPGKIITLYIATVAQAKAFYPTESHLPTKLYKTVSKNQCFVKVSKIK